MSNAQELDPVMVRIGEAIELGQNDRQELARQRFAELWDEVGAGDDPLYRVLIAHYGADVEAAPMASLTWNLRALDAAMEATDEAVQRHHAELRVAAFYPSLHLNLARDYFDLGDEGSARAHYEAALERVEILPDDAYGRLVRAGLAKMAADLAGESAPVGPRSSCVQHAHADHPHN